jgi:hypothetical protein
MVDLFINQKIPPECFVMDFECKVTFTHNLCLCGIPYCCITRFCKKLLLVKKNHAKTEIGALIINEPIKRDGNLHFLIVTEILTTGLIYFIARGRGF